jgi:hypothetical protein
MNWSVVYDKENAASLTRQLVVPRRQPIVECLRRHPTLRSAAVADAKIMFKPSIVGVVETESTGLGRFV